MYLDIWTILDAYQQKKKTNIHCTTITNSKSNVVWSIYTHVKLYMYLQVKSNKLAGGISERCWHERCLKCCMCGKNMQNTCFEREGRFYCTHDYYR